MIRGYAIRIYPTKEQEEKLWKSIGSCRFIWNWMLAEQQKIYKEGGKHLTGYQMCDLLTKIKHTEDYSWLNEVSCSSLQLECQELGMAYEYFFKKIHGFPKFKSKKHPKKSYPVRAPSLKFTERAAFIEKVGWIKYKTDLDVLGKTKYRYVRVSFREGKWFLSFSCDRENQTVELTNKNMGIDLGVKHTAIVAYGSEYLFYDNINKSKKMKALEARIKHKQHVISKKYETSNKKYGRFIESRNIARERSKLSMLCAKARHIRKNYNHQLTRALVDLKPMRIVMEDLNVQGLMKNHKIAKAIQEQNLYGFKRMMRYKSEELCIEFILADRYYPSSKTCSECGSIKTDLKLSERVFVCQECGFTIDRDINAAINLQRYIA